MKNRIIDCASRSLILLSMIFMGCTVGPRYQTPQIDIPKEWHTPPSEGMTNAPTDCLLWWESLNDPILNALMERAAQQNLDLSIAETRILEARLMRKGKEAERYPHIDASLTAGNLYCSKEILKEGLFKHNASGKRNLNFFELGFDADWEIDLFGFHRHQVNAAEAKIEAAEANLSDIWISLSAEIARNYIELRGFQQRQFLLQQNIEISNDSVHLSKELLAIGMVNSMDLFRAEEQLNLLKADKPLIDLSINKTIHRLSTLLGHSPGELFSELSDPQELPHLPLKQPLGFPSELLRRRADIRKAERNLAAATEEVGTAIAALYPRFSLYGFVGEISSKLSSMTNGNGITWFAAPQLLFPIFNSRMLKQDVEFNQYQASQALFEYQKTVIAALEEVENSMATFRYELERKHQLDQTHHLSQEAYQLCLELYQKGFKDYLDVLISNQSLLQAQEVLIQSEINLLLDYIALYKALGGGWAISTDCSSL